MDTDTTRLTRPRVFALAGTACVMLLLVGLRPISDVDLFWQVKLGQLARDGGGLGAADRFTSTHPGEPFPPLCWLAQLVYATLFDVGHSLRLLQGVDNLLFVGAFLVAGLSVRRPEARPAAVVTGMAVGFLVALPHNSLRPQTFALLAFAVLLALHASRRPAWVKLLGGGLLLVAWQNLHPSVLVAGVSLAALLAADAWEWWRGRRPGQPGTTAALLALVVLCQFATPMGTDVLAVSSRNAWLARNLPQPCQEWLPCWDARVLPVALPTLGLAVALTLLLLIRLRFQARPADLALLAVLAVLSAYAFRFGLFLAVAAVPAWARLAERSLSPRPLIREGETARRPAWACIAAGVFAVALAATLPVLARPRLAASHVPLDGVRRLSEELPAGRVYNFQPYGGPLIWEGFPRWQVLMDGRIYFFSDPEWEEYYGAAAGRVPVDVLVRRHAPDAFFLHPEFHAGLIRELREHPGWREVYADESCRIFVRASPSV